jgi:hypothetical protein
MIKVTVMTGRWSSRAQSIDSDGTASTWVKVKVLLPQYDPEPPVRPVFKFIHGPVTRHGCRQSCYTVQIGAPA